jgi:Fe-S-cluster containining protein
MTKANREWYKPAGDEINRVLDAYARTLFGMCDDFDEAVHAQLDVTCKKSCDHCCYLAFYSNILEGLVIARYLLVHREDKIDTLMPNMEECAKLQEQVGPEGWFQLQRPCVYLEDSLCLIYPVRPWNCRTHYAISPPENCRGPEPKQVGSPDVRQIETMHRELCEGVMEMLAGNKAPIVGPLPMVVATGLQMLVGQNVDLGALYTEQSTEMTEADKKKWSRSTGEKENE